MVGIGDRVIKLVTDQFGVEIPDDDADKIKTVAEAIRYIEGAQAPA